MMLGQLPNRSGAIDLVRLIAVAAIVAGHAFTQEATALWLYSWHVPVFFILTGYLWKPDRTLRVELSRRALSLGRPYIFSFIALTAVLLIVDADGAPARILGGLEGGRSAQMPYVTLWFVSALFFTALAFRAIGRLPYGVQWGIGIAGAVAGWIWTEPLSHTLLGVGYVATCLIYLLIGDAVRRVRGSIRRPLITGTAALAAGVVLVATRVAAPVDIKVGDDGTPVLSLIASSAISIGLLLIAESLVRPGSFSKICTLLALPLLTVVLLHPLVLWLHVPNGVMFVLGILVPLAIGLASLRTPLSPWVTGQNRMRSASA